MTKAQKESVQSLGIIYSSQPLPIIEEEPFAPPKKEIRRFTPPKIIHDYPEGEGATADEVKEYEAIVKEMKVSGRGYREIAGKSDKVYPIYQKMTNAQRSKASQLPPPPPPPAEPPPPPTEAPPPPPKGVTQNEQASYNAILSKLEHMSEAEKNKDSYKKWNEGVNNAAAIYNRMSDAQKTNVKMPPPKITKEEPVKVVEMTIVETKKDPARFTPPKIVKDKGN